MHSLLSCSHWAYNKTSALRLGLCNNSLARMNYELNKAPVVACSQSFTTAREKKPGKGSVAEVGAAAGMNLTVWFLGHWKYFVARMWKSLVL